MVFTEGIGRINGQVQDIRAVASMNGRIRFGINTSHRIGVAAPVEALALTNGLIFIERIGRIYTQMQRVGAVASMDGGVRFGVIAGSCVCVAFPCIAVSIADGVTFAERVGWMNF